MHHVGLCSKSRLSACCSCAMHIRHAVRVVFAFFSLFRLSDKLFEMCFVYDHIAAVRCMHWTCVRALTLVRVFLYWMGWWKKKCALSRSLYCTTSIIKSIITFSHTLDLQSCALSQLFGAMEQLSEGPLPSHHRLRTLISSCDTKAEKNENMCHRRGHAIEFIVRFQ